MTLKQRAAFHGILAGNVLEAFDRNDPPIAPNLVAWYQGIAVDHARKAFQYARLALDTRAILAPPTPRPH